MSLQSNVKTKKEFKEVAIGKPIARHTFAVGLQQMPDAGYGIAVEGPYPVHKWYATVDTDDYGIVRKVR